MARAYLITIHGISPSNWQDEVEKAFWPHFTCHERLEQKELLERVLGELTPDDSELVWHVAQGYTLEETARRLGMSASNARVRMHRIRKRLRDEFPEEADK